MTSLPLAIKRGGDITKSGSGNLQLPVLWAQEPSFLLLEFTLPWLLLNLPCLLKF